MNVRGESMEPVENVFWASSPSGKYKVFVRNFNNHVRDGTVFTDAGRKVPFVCYLTRNGKRETFRGEAGPKEDVTCFEFTHKGNGALGSFVVLPPAGHDTTFKEAAAAHEVTYTVGSGYYAVARKEKIQAYKDMYALAPPPHTRHPCDAWRLPCVPPRMPEVREWRGMTQRYCTPTAHTLP